MDKFDVDTDIVAHFFQLLVDQVDFLEIFDQLQSGESELTVNTT
jgi:hypothetical protein